MTKLEKAKDTIADFWWWVKIVTRVIIWQVMIALIACGVLYISNFHVSIEKNVQVISPIGGVK